MRQYWMLAGVVLLSAGLAAGVTVAALDTPSVSTSQQAEGAGLWAMAAGTDGPPPDGQGPGMRGPPPDGQGRGMRGPPPDGQGRGMRGPPGGPGGRGRGPGGPAGPMMGIDRVEAALGKPLTDDQKKQLTDAATKMQAAHKAALDAYLQTVAEVTGLTADQIRQMQGPPPPPPPPGAPDSGMKGPPRGGPPARGDGPPPPPAAGQASAAPGE